MKINVPPGVDSGAMMHLPGQGNDGWGLGRPGDLYVVLNVADDARFDRHGQTLFTTLELTFAQAALGDHVEIDGLDAPVEIEIARHTARHAHPHQERGSAAAPRRTARRARGERDRQGSVPA